MSTPQTSACALKPLLFFDNLVSYFLQVDLVMGLTSSCTEAAKRSGCRPIVESAHPRFQMGLYLVAATGGNELVLGAHHLTKGVEWGTPTAANRLWANLAAFSPRWNCVCLRDRLPEVSVCNSRLMIN
ncbi:unnamed protein product [Dibothriocephalus latus]|uniref:Uncharacterized protein n=1 Tax=Dibothriocephalus latus TaxID=60516 RepID=A0A3P7NCZ8_DIBLA|nr:unnamed protein product [Dibothriocephalus latus]